jgi:hypothetical protein
VPVVQWNWKSAVLSVALKTPVFIVSAATAGSSAVLTTAATDVACRVTVAGFSGGVLQRMSRVQPRWAGTLGGFLLVPALSHAAEWLVHGWDGTPHLGLAVAASVMLSVVSTGFDLYAMRRGVLIVGSGSASLTRDLRQVPGLWRDLARAIVGYRRPRSGIASR